MALSLLLQLLLLLLPLPLLRLLLSRVQSRAAETLLELRLLLLR